MNIWKGVTILLLILLLGLAALLYIDSTSYYDYGKFKIKKTTLKDLTGYIDDTKPFVLCDIKQDECVKLGRIGE